MHHIPWLQHYGTLSPLTTQSDALYFLTMTGWFPVSLDQSSLMHWTIWWCNHTISTAQQTNTCVTNDISYMLTGVTSCYPNLPYTSLCNAAHLFRPVFPQLTGKVFYITVSVLCVCNLKTAANPALANEQLTDWPWKLFTSPLSLTALPGWVTDWTPWPLPSSTDHVLVSNTYWIESRPLYTTDAATEFTTTTTQYNKHWTLMSFIRLPTSSHTTLIYNGYVLHRALRSVIAITR